MPYYYGYGFGIDPLYLLVVLVCTVLGLAAQNYINSTYKTWSKVRSDGDTGATVARRMLDANGCNAVGIKGVAGELTDHYNPQDNNLYLSDSNRSGGSVASVAVACHEAGHAAQRQKNVQMGDAALALATHRVVVKRARKAPAIAGPKPTLVLEGNSSRFDIYPKKSLKSKKLAR